MPLSACAGIFFVLMGLFAVWIGFAIRHLRELRSPAEMRLWLIGWAMGALAFFCMGVTTLRYAKGRYVSVPASAPLIDKVLWVLVSVGVVGFIVAQFALMILGQRREERDLHRDPRDT